MAQMRLTSARTPRRLFESQDQDEESRVLELLCSALRNCIEEQSSILEAFRQIAMIPTFTPEDLIKPRMPRGLSLLSIKTMFTVGGADLVDSILGDLDNKDLGNKKTQELYNRRLQTLARAFKAS